MSHEITIRRNGKAEMAYTGAAPWHGLGSHLENGGTIEEWIVAAGMDYRVLRSVVRFATERNPSVADFLALNDKHVLFRSDNKTPLAVVSDVYKVVQPKEILEFFRDLVEEMGFTLETAGTMHGGKKYWALARVTSDEGILDSADKVGGYLLLSTSADGTTPTTGRFTTVRVVCKNTLAAAFGQAKAGFSLTHRSRFDPIEAKRELGITGVQDAFAEQMQTFRRLASTKLSANTMTELTLKLLAGGADAFKQLDQDAVLKLAKKRPAAMIGTMAGTGQGLMGADMRGGNGTAWAWLNAVTQYVDHAARAGSVDNRLQSAWFGPGNSLKQEALVMAMETAGQAAPQVFVSAESTGSSLLDDVLAQGIAA